VLAETGGWRDPNRLDFTVKISLGDTNDAGLKPSMRCKANIHVGRVSNSLFVPLQAVFHTGPLAYVYVPRGGGYDQKKVEIGRASELFTEIVSGLEEGQMVLLREPESEEILARLPLPRRDSATDGEELAGQPDGDKPVAVGVMPGMQGKTGTNGGGEAGKQGGEGRRGNRAASDGSSGPRRDRTESAQSHDASNAAEATTVAADADMQDNDASPSGTEPTNASGDAAPAEAPAMTAAPASPS
jgi:hypothetical protein